MRKPTKQMIREAKKARDRAENNARQHLSLEFGPRYLDGRLIIAADPMFDVWVKRAGDQAYRDTLALLAAQRS